MKEVRNYIAGHKYHRGAWNLPHKFHLYLIENGQEKISPTCKGSGSGVTQWLCNSVRACATKGLITLPPFIRLGQNFFCVHLGKKVCLKKKKILGRGPKNQWFVKLSQLFDKTQVWNLKFRPKLQKKLKYLIKKFRPIAVGRRLKLTMPIFVHINFFQ